MSPAATSASTLASASALSPANWLKQGQIGAQPDMLDAEDGDGVGAEMLAEVAEHLVEVRERQARFGKDQEMQLAEISFGCRHQVEDRTDLRPLRLRVDQPAGSLPLAQPIGNLADQAVQVVPGGVVEAQVLVDDAEHGAGLTEYPVARTRSASSSAGWPGSARSAGEEPGQHVAGARGHAEAVQFLRRNPAGFGDFGAVRAQFAAERMGTIVKDHVMVVLRADADMFVDIDQPIDPAPPARPPRAPRGAAPPAATRQSRSFPRA